MNIKTIDRFHANLINLTDLIIEIIPNEIEGISIGILDLGKAHLDSWNEKDKENAILNFIKTTNKYWTTLIFEKNRNFLVKKSKKIFPYFGIHSNIFKKLFSDENYIPTEDIELIWTYIISFIKQSIKYIHENRKPTHTIIKKRYTPIYSCEYMEYIDISTLAKFWEINLEWPPSTNKTPNSPNSPDNIIKKHE